MNNKQVGRTFQKPKNTKYVLKKLWQYLYHYKWLLLLALVMTVATNLFALIGPKLAGTAIEIIEYSKQGEIKIDEVMYYAILMVIAYVSSAILSYTLSLVMIKMSKKIVYKMREDAFNKLSTLPLNYYDTNTIGDIISKMSYDIDTINTSLSSDLISICTSVITVIGSLFFMLTIAPLLVLVFAFTIPISLVFTRFMLKKTHPLFRARSRTLGELNGYIEEMVTGTKTIKAYGKEKDILNKFDELNTTAVESAYNAEYYGSITGPGVNFVNNLSLSLICIFGAFMYIGGSLTFGGISSFVMYSRKFSGPINEVANIFVDIQSALAAGERVFALIDGEPEKQDVKGAVVLDNVMGNVEFKNVEFGYTKEKTIIKNLSFKASSGQVIAIVGPTGAGKTTIVNLLMRFYDIDNGKITVDKTNIKYANRSSLRKSYAMVLQDTWLFQGTVFENIAYGKDNATLDDVIEVCKVAKIHNFITRLPNGYDTILDEGGINISKGQKQLLTIARAMLLDAKMLILDEATSNVDTRTEIQIQEAMKQLMKNKTCFIIAHRLSTIQSADLILVVKDGNIVEQGTHTNLIKLKGFYNEMYYSQFE